MQGQESKYISGEGYQSMRHNKPPRGGISPLVWVAIAVVIIGAGAFVTLTYLKHNDNANNTNLTTGSTNGEPSNGNGMTPINNSGGGAPSGCASGCSPQQIGGGGGGQTLVVHTGTVTAVSSGSITIQPSGSSSAETFSITNDTQVFDGNSNTALNPSNIQTGETVNVNTAGSSSTQAVVIVVRSPGN